MKRNWALGALALLILTGCGAQPLLPTAPKAPRQPRPVVETPAPIAGAPAGQIDALLATMATAQRTLKTAKWKGLMYCRGSWGTKPKVLKQLSNGEWEAYSTYETIYKKPEHYRVHITACTNPNSIGVKMLIKNEQVEARLPGLLSLVPFKSTLSAPQTMNFRGHRLDYGSFDGIVKRLASGPAPDAKLAGQMVMENKTLDVVEFNRTPSWDKSIVKEVIGIDRITHLPVYHAMYTAERKVYELKYMGLKTNVSVPAEFDKL